MTASHLDPPFKVRSRGAVMGGESLPMVGPILSQTQAQMTSRRHLQTV